MNVNKTLQWQDFDSNFICATCDGIFVDAEAFRNHKCEPLNKVGKDEPFQWNHNAILGLLTVYHTIQPDKENVRKHKHFWQNLAKDLRTLGYEVTADHTRWKFNALLKKYKECVDNNSKSGRSPMTFAYFNEMQEMFGHRKNINCNHIIGSSFFGSKRQSSSFVESDKQISTATKRKQAISSTSESLPTKLSRIECQQELLNMASSAASSETSSDIVSETPLSKERKKSRPGSATYVAKTKLELEKQWLEHLKVLAIKNQKDNEKLKRIDERLQLKEKQLLWKEAVVKRKMEKKEERHRERMRIENEKCQLLKELVDSKHLFSMNDMLSFKK
ncbi:PREDICTED: uncharacterized protein LOC108759917 [Trachymyrmex cornetzi]|uniref:uncharacterized protein LOC108759917 n=1 Tax=Trachymyrmex cornetzi TaxID=471704 RepID=UPI00084F0244|nr:PREDICTED: uncharacterized protein LOC108759917 [Trachymyrmex cornetzi]